MVTVYIECLSAEPIVTIHILVHLFPLRFTPENDSLNSHMTEGFLEPCSKSCWEYVTITELLILLR